VKVWTDQHRGLTALLGAILVLLGGIEAILSLLDRLGIELELPELAGLLPLAFDLIRVSFVFAGVWLLGLVYLGMKPQSTDQTALSSSPTREANVRRWLPNPNDLRSLQMTNADMDNALLLASELARELLAPDAILVFESIALGPAPRITFLASSEAAGRSGPIVVTEYGAAPSDALTQPPPYARPDDPPDYVLAMPALEDPGPAAPWRTDSTWRDLIDMAWYRFRPQRENVYLRYEHRDGSSGPREFHVCLYPVGPDRNRADCYAIRDGHLELAYGALG
jgi:hypothetical protein